MVTSQYGSLVRQRLTVYDGYSELAGLLFVTVKVNGLGNFLQQLRL